MGEEVKMAVVVITDGSDQVPATSINRSGAELRRLYIKEKRREFLNENGEDFFVKEGPATEKNKRAQWEKEANRTFPDQGDYSVPLVEGTNPAAYDSSKAVYLGKI